MLKVLIKLKYFLSPEKEFRRLISNIVGFEPNSIQLYRIALTHRSLGSTYKSTIENNERLEFLGDAVLDAIVAEYLFKIYPDQNEGFLTVMRSRIVNGEILYDLSMKTGLWRLIRYPGSATSKKHIFGDAFEALIGAIFVDKGYKTAYHFFIEQILTKYIDLEKLRVLDSNFKSLLLEHIQKCKLHITFDTFQEPESTKNNPVFISEIFIGNQLAGTGSGCSKKEAEQNASREALEKSDFLFHPSMRQ